MWWREEEVHWGQMQGHVPHKIQTQEPRNTGQGVGAHINRKPTEAELPQVRGC